MIRKITIHDNAAVANIIRTVMPEFGASGKGFAIHDDEVDRMFETYTQPRSAYFVWDDGGQVVGGGGIAPLAGGPDDVCELKKMYFLPEGRGKGSGRALLRRCLEAAKSAGFKSCYLETFNTMSAAMKLYESEGFSPLPGPLGNTGHFACDRFYLKALF